MSLNIKRSALVKVAKELNEVLGLEPPIDVNQKPEVLINLLVEASKLVEEGDEITKETQDTLKYLAGKQINQRQIKEIEVGKTPQEDAKKSTSAQNKNKNQSQGVLACIVEIIETAGKEGVSKEEILEKLVEKFPERNKESMRKTINIQVPYRISKERFELGKTESGKYFKK